MSYFGSKEQKLDHLKEQISELKRKAYFEFFNQKISYRKYSEEIRMLSELYKEEKAKIEQEVPNG